MLQVESQLIWVDIDWRHFTTSFIVLSEKSHLAHELKHFPERVVIRIVVSICFEIFELLSVE